MRPQGKRLNTHQKHAFMEQLATLQADAPENGLRLHRQSQLQQAVVFTSANLYAAAYSIFRHTEQARIKAELVNCLAAADLAPQQSHSPSPPKRLTQTGLNQLIDRLAGPFIEPRSKFSSKRNQVLSLLSRLQQMTELREQPLSVDLLAKVHKSTGKIDGQEQRQIKGAIKQVFDESLQLILDTFIKRCGYLTVDATKLTDFYFRQVVGLVPIKFRTSHELEALLDAFIMDKAKRIELRQKQEKERQASFQRQHLLQQSQQSAIQIPFLDRVSRDLAKRERDREKAIKVGDQQARKERLRTAKQGKVDPKKLSKLSRPKRAAK